MEHDWALVAKQHFDLTDCEFDHYRKHRKDHYVLRAQGERWMLSTAPIDNRRPPFEWQFKAMQALNATGFWQVRLPYLSVEGRPYAVHDKHWWMLRWYAMSDEHVDWEAPDLVADAARTLAALHDAAERVRPILPPPPLDPALLDPALLDPYHWSVPEIIAGSEELSDKVRGRRLNRGQVRYVKDAVCRLRAEANGVLARRTRLGSKASPIRTSTRPTYGSCMAGC